MKTRKTLKKKILLALAPRIVKMAITTFGLTYKKVYYGLEHFKELDDKRQNWIIATWHNNILGDSLLLRNQKLVSMVSASTDGMIAAKLLDLMGYQTVRGSTSKGGAKVLLTMIKEIKSGKNGAITPDGPRGPKYTLQEGAISVAQRTGAPLIPFHFESTNQWVFEKSWDHHKFPKPFSTIVISIGEPFFVPPKLSGEEFETNRKAFEGKMMDNVFRTSQLIKKIKENE